MSRTVLMDIVLNFEAMITGGMPRISFLLWDEARVRGVSWVQTHVATRSVDGSQSPHKEGETTMSREDVIKFEQALRSSEELQAKFKAAVGACIGVAIIDCTK